MRGCVLPLFPLSGRLAGACVPRRSAARAGDQREVEVLSFYPKGLEFLFSRVYLLTVSQGKLFEVTGEEQENPMFGFRMEEEEEEEGKPMFMLEEEEEDVGKMAISSLVGVFESGLHGLCWWLPEQRQVVTLLSKKLMDYIFVCWSLK